VHGAVVMAWEIEPAFALIAMAWYFLPWYSSGNITTVPQFLENHSPVNPVSEQTPPQNGILAVTEKKRRKKRSQPFTPTLNKYCFLKESRFCW